MTRALTVALGGAALGTADLVLDIGPQHPATHGVLRLALTLDGDTIATADPIVGFMHRGSEKLFEVRDYRQITVLANRHDWLSAFSSELGVVLAVERMLGMELPTRAVWLRTLLAELNRVMSHLLFLGGADASLVALTTRHREAIVTVLEEATGGRLHYMANRVGGLHQDVPRGWPARVERAVASARQALPELAVRLAATGLAGLGVLAPELVSAYGISGPLARASGVDMDLRRDQPYLAYGELAPMRVVLGSRGDALARFEVLLGQVAVSLDLVDACLAALPAGPIDVKLPKTVRAPEGSIYSWTENPLGIMGYYLVSRGEKTPWRLAMRTASFNNVSALPAVLSGVRLPDLPAVLSSLFFVVGDLDK